MAMACFKWQGTEHQLLIIQAREDRKLKRAVWWDEDEDTKDIVGDRDEHSGGTWFGCSKQGRVALLVNVTHLTSLRNAGAELLTVKFLKGKMTPREFANELEMNKNLSSELTFSLVVADIHSKTMFYISKKTQNKEVDEAKEVRPGSYCICSGEIFDLSCPTNNSLKDALGELFTESLSKTEWVNKHTRDDQFMVTECEGEIDTSTAGLNGKTQLIVNPTGKANFSVTYFENGEYENSHRFDFDIE